MNQQITQIIIKNEPDILVKKQQADLFQMREKIANLDKSRDFLKHLKQGLEKSKVGLISEIKLASPSEKQLGKAEDITARAQEYEHAGANAISIITEKYYFNGDIGFIQQIKEVTSLPVLQKDFVVDPIQIYESRVNGADALLLIAKIVSTEQLIKFVDLCFEIGLEPVVEINDELDLQDALQTKTRIIAVNARDLDTMFISVGRASELLTKVPESYFKLGFSGIESNKEVELYKTAGAKAVLVGTNLMKAENIQEFVKSLRN